MWLWAISHKEFLAFVQPQRKEVVAEYQDAMRERYRMERFDFNANSGKPGLRDARLNTISAAASSVSC